jgi:hypothetical protein
LLIVADRPTPAIATPTSSSNPYELALLRLEFLTAVPSIGRSGDPSWPNAFIDAAARALDLDSRSHRFLRLAANTFVAGNHDAGPRLTRLTKVLRADEWPLLLLDFERLNPDSDEEAVMEVVRRASEIARLPQNPVVTSAPAPMVHPHLPQSAADTGSSWPGSALRPRAPDDSRHANVADAPRPSWAVNNDANQRDMGALKGMFDD